jgi:hypothetical protein
MPRNEFYCQCRMRRPVEGKPNAYEEMVSWIPSDIAKVGNVVKLKEWSKDEEWSENWTITSAGPKTNGGKVEARAGDYKKQRGESDAVRDNEGRWETPDRRGKKGSA